MTLPSHCSLISMQANDAGDYFPIWGTCQGFQQLSVLTANKNLLTLTDTKAVALPLTLTPGILLLLLLLLLFSSLSLSSATSHHKEEHFFFFSLFPARFLSQFTLFSVTPVSTNMLLLYCLKKSSVSHMHTKY